MRFRYNKIFQFIILLLIVLVIGCSSSKIKPDMASEKRLKVAKKLLDDGNYMKAKTQFTVLVLNYPGTDIADEAQYFLAEAHFGDGEYILAAEEYRKLIRNYPGSEFVDDAQYKLGLSYYKLSPHYALDQKYTFNAIDEYQRFLEEYPQSDLKQEVEKKLSKCRNKLAKKQYKSGELYQKLAYYDSAIIYYDQVLDNYYDTPYGSKALYHKGKCLMKLGRWEKAQQVFEVFLEKYPKDPVVESVQEELDKIQNNISDNNK